MNATEDDEYLWNAIIRDLCLDSSLGEIDEIYDLNLCEFVRDRKKHSKSKAVEKKATSQQYSNVRSKVK